MTSLNFKPRLLRETVEIALTEIKRFIEPELMEVFSLRRVSAPLYLPAGSMLLDARYPGVQISLPGTAGNVELVGSLDVWLRGQLARYDIAPGFGVFTVMNALRPEVPQSATTSPHIAAWAWQQAIDPAAVTKGELEPVARKLYAVLTATEKMILEKFPHLNATLHKTLDVLECGELERRMPDYGHERRIYEYLHPDYRDRVGSRTSDGCHCAALFVTRGTQGRAAEGELWVWNRILNRPVCVADLAVWDGDEVAGPSVGGNIYRGNLALQILHQNRLPV